MYYCQIDTFAESKDTWNTKEGTGKSMPENQTWGLLIQLTRLIMMMLD